MASFTVQLGGVFVPSDSGARAGPNVARAFPVGIWLDEVPKLVRSTCALHYMWYEFDQGLRL